jgi:cell division protein ZipA
MSVRELVILILGLAIVAVILRGLYVAVQARRGQIRLAIDKNIPASVDLDAMELSELPSGGARVVERSLAEVNSQNRLVEAANARAAAMELGVTDEASQSVPVLMDAVELTSAQGRQQHSSSDFAAAEVEAAEELDAAEEFYDSDGFDEAEQSDAAEEYEDPDAVLFDYGEVVSDGMAGVTPDYPEQDDSDADWDDEEEDTATAAADATDYEDLGQVEDYAPEFEGEDEAGDDYAVDSETETETETETDYYDEPDELESAERHEPALASSTSFEDGLDEFSMTAGERIGFEGSKPKPKQQSELFEDLEDEPPQVEPPKPRKSLFTAFARRKGKSRPVQPEQLESEQEAAAVSWEASLEANAAAQAQTEAIAAAKSKPAPEPPPSQPSEVLVINVMAGADHVFTGDDLMQVLIGEGLKFGEMNIFHQRSGDRGTGPIIFSVANSLNPGTFDLNKMSQFNTIGVSMFLALPAPINSLEAFGQMLATAQEVCAALDGELKDDNRNFMTAQTIEHYRQRIRDFELRQLKAASSRS